MNADVEKAVEECRQCGMFCNTGEFHPYAACLMYEACHNAETVRANLEGVRDYALRDQEAEIADLKADRDSLADQASDRVKDWDDMRQRDEKAEVLLRKCRQMLPDYCEDLVSSITAHLGGEQ